MKKITLVTFLFMTAAFFSNAQIDNGRFETWTDSTVGAYTYDSLVHWMTTDLISQQNSSTHVHSAEQETANVYEGTSSIRLTSWTAGGIIPGVPGAASNGNVLVTGLSVSPIGGVPDVMRHAALSGYYQYTPAGSDHGSIETVLYKRNGASRDTIAYGAFDVAFPMGTYTHFTIGLTPMSTDDPDSSLIWIQSSPRSPIGAGVTGSVLRVDSLYYTGQIGIDDISPLVKAMLTYPVPAVNEINVKVELVSPGVSMIYEILDKNGNIVASDKMHSNTQKIDVSKLAAGNYFVNLRDLSGQKLCADRFTIAR
jgi:hypothetical protein